MTEPKTRGIDRGAHIVFAIGLFEKMNDADLKQSFVTTKSAADLRAYLQELRDAGYSYIPCSCEDVNADGSCKGWEEAN